MIPKPNGLQPKYGAKFKVKSIVAAYQHRPRYPQELFDILSALITDQPRHVLDVGCGTGFGCNTSKSLFSFLSFNFCATLAWRVILALL